MGVSCNESSSRNAVKFHRPSRADVGFVAHTVVKLGNVLSERAVVSNQSLTDSWIASFFFELACPSA